MKKTACILFFLLAVTLSFASCSKKEDYAFKSEFVNISQGVCNYYLDRAGQQGLEGEEAQQQAIFSCKEIVAAEKLMREKGISVRAYYKRQTAEETEKLWSMFSAHYKKIDVTKQDINFVTFQQYRKKELLHYYYGTDGIKAVSSDELKEEFVDLYVGFKAIEGSLTKLNAMGERVELTEKEKEGLEGRFRAMAARINNQSATIDELNAEYNENLGLIVTDSLPLVLVKEKDPMYDSDFFGKVMDIPHGFARVIKSGSSLFLVQREKIATDDDDAFAEYSALVLESMRMDEIEKKIEKLAKKIEL